MDRGSTFRRIPNIHLPELVKKLLANDRISLGKAITLLESKNVGDQRVAGELMDMILPHTGKSFRIGISGVPGVGKSTFIDAFGSYLTSQGLKIAVLSIDPSSSRTKGSILGDKTRMENLARDPNAFIRPTASGNYLGGVATNTRETILLCEAAGFDVILVETVGVGQSETMVKEMVDYFLLLMLAGSGDELQGIKRGIMEMADHVLINKADGDNIQRAKRAREDFKNAIHLFPPNEASWTVPVGMCSALEKSGIADAWLQMKNYQEQTKANSWLSTNRHRQNLKWFHHQVRAKLELDFFKRDEIKASVTKIEDAISNQKLSVRKAVDALFS